jgi:putative effector of murein hydrolase
MFLDCAVVILGYPLFKQFKAIAKQFHVMLMTGLVSSLSVIILCVAGGRVLGISDTTIYSMVMMCTTTPIAMETAELLGGSASLAAIMVLLAGVSGGVLAGTWFTFININDARARGLAIGAASHALGTATIAQTSIQSAAYASTALLMCAIITAVLAPLLVPVLLPLFWALASAA